MRIDRGSGSQEGWSLKAGFCTPPPESHGTREDMKSYPPPVNRQMLLKTLPSFTVGKNGSPIFTPGEWALRIRPEECDAGTHAVHPHRLAEIGEPQQKPGTEI